jgi:hypothetical protein
MLNFLVTCPRLSRRPHAGASGHRTCCRRTRGQRGRRGVRSACTPPGAPALDGHVAHGREDGLAHSPEFHTSTRSSRERRERRSQCPTRPGSRTSIRRARPRTLRLCARPPHGPFARARPAVARVSVAHALGHAASAHARRTVRSRAHVRSRRAPPPHRASNPPPRPRSGCATLSRTTRSPRSRSASVSRPARSASAAHAHVRARPTAGRCGLRTRHSRLRRRGRRGGTFAPIRTSAGTPVRRSRLPPKSAASARAAAGARAGARRGRARLGG